MASLGLMALLASCQQPAQLPATAQPVAQSSVARQLSAAQIDRIVSNYAQANALETHNLLTEQGGLMTYATELSNSKLKVVVVRMGNDPIKVFGYKACKDCPDDAVRTAVTDMSGRLMRGNNAVPARP